MTDQAWHDWRAQGIGGSDVPKILGLSTFGDAWSVFIDKTSIDRKRADYSERQRIGLDLEPYLAASFARRTGLTIAGEQTWITDNAHPWRRCTLDGLVMDGDTPVATWQAKTWHTFKPWQTWENVPPAVLAQIMWEMGVTGIRSAWLTVMYAGFTLEHLPVPFDADVWAWIAGECDRFWTEHVLTGVAPDPTGNPHTADLIRDTWPQSEPVAVEIPADLHEQWGAARDARLKAEKEEAELGNRIKALMREADTATVGGIPVLSWKTTERDEIDPRAERMPKPRKPAVEIPERARKFYNPEPTRVLRPIKTKEAA